MSVGIGINREESEMERRETSFNDLQAAVERIVSYAGSLQPHPVFGPISSDEWLEFHTIHAMHHLSFLAPADTAGAAA